MKASKKTEVSGSFVAKHLSSFEIASQTETKTEIETEKETDDRDNVKQRDVDSVSVKDRDRDRRTVFFCTKIEFKTRFKNRF